MPAVIGYLVTRRNKIDEIRISKGYKLAENIAKKIQRIQDDYLYFENLYNLNYINSTDFHQLMENFTEKESLFFSDHKRIEDFISIRKQLVDLIQGAWIYLSLKEIEAVKSYLDIGDITISNDALGVDKYALHRSFFSNILENKKTRAKKYKLIIKLFSKIKF